jgi:hypothetical protein
MKKNPSVDETYSPTDAKEAKDEVVEIGTSTQVIYVDPEKEKSAFKKFDRYVVPASFVFMLLCALDRNNVSAPTYP